MLTARYILALFVAIQLSVSHTQNVYDSLESQSNKQKIVVMIGHHRLIEDFKAKMLLAWLDKSKIGELVKFIEVHFAYDAPIFDTGFCHYQVAFSKELITDSMSEYGISVLNSLLHFPENTINLTANDFLKEKDTNPFVRWLVDNKFVPGEGIEFFKDYPQAQVAIGYELYAKINFETNLGTISTEELLPNENDFEKKWRELIDASKDKKKTTSVNPENMGTEKSEKSKEEPEKPKIEHKKSSFDRNQISILFLSEPYHSGDSIQLMREVGEYLMKRQEQARKAWEANYDLVEEILSSQVTEWRGLPIGQDIPAEMLPQDVKDIYNRLTSEGEAEYENGVYLKKVNIKIKLAIKMGYLIPDAGYYGWVYDREWRTLRGFFGYGFEK